ncbi:MAG: hypothetical protein ACYCY2_10940 [Acidithiobacillus ferriphilus]|uniref:hypothetical protein n=1 Tax=Acidithiobacillus ferriphilus TaxID=1689834 RepID=UPI001C0784D1|nr:hypothetical protein [Acidithiobacillus ferriphilus]MBU2827090.1 hypothetical protein [Acidithiobacillus ferriphilus]
MDKRIFAYSVLAAALAAALSGCSKSTVGSGSENTNGTEQSSGVEKKMDVNTQRQAALEIKEPAVPILVSALRRSIDAGKPRGAVLNPDLGWTIVDGTAAVKMGLAPLKKSTVLVGYPYAFSATPCLNEKLAVAKLEKGAAGGGADAGIAKVELAAYRRNPQSLCVHYAAGVATIFGSAMPIMGWRDGFNERKDDNFAQGLAETAQFSNLLLTRLYYSLPKTALAGQREARIQIVKAFYEIPSYDLARMWNRAKAVVADQGVTINGSGSIPDGGAMGFRIGGATYVGGQSGLSVTQDGVKWLGDGRISGREVSLSFSRNVSRSLGESRSLGRSEREGVSGKTHEEANVAGQGG